MTISLPNYSLSATKLGKDEFFSFQSFGPISRQKLEDFSFQPFKNFGGTSVPHKTRVYLPDKVLLFTTFVQIQARRNTRVLDTIIHIIKSTLHESISFLHKKRIRSMQMFCPIQIPILCLQRHFGFSMDACLEMNGKFEKFPISPQLLSRVTNIKSRKMGADTKNSSCSTC